MFATPILRNHETKVPLSDVFRRSLELGISPKDRLFAIRYLMDRIPPQDNQDIVKLKESTVIANTRQPPGYLHNGRGEYIQITKNEDLSYALIFISPIMDQLHTFAFFAYEGKEMFMAAPKSVAFNYEQMSFILDPQPPKGGEPVLLGGGSLRFITNGRLVDIAGRNREKLLAKAVSAVENTVGPMKKQLADFAKDIGVEWIADRLNYILA